MFEEILAFHDFFCKFLHVLAKFSHSNRLYLYTDINIVYILYVSVFFLSEEFFIQEGQYFLKIISSFAITCMLLWASCVVTKETKPQKPAVHAQRDHKERETSPKNEQNRPNNNANMPSPFTENYKRESNKVITTGIWTPNKNEIDRF